MTEKKPLMLKKRVRSLPPVLIPVVALLLWQNMISGCASIPDNNIHVAQTDLAAQEEFDEFDEFNNEDEPEVPDPLGGYNRFMFNVNDKIYFWFLKPVARGYGKVIPEQARVPVQRCAKNLAFPVRFVNSGLQGKFKGAGSELARFGINSTVGLLGLFDPAYSFFDLHPSAEDFGQTLGLYGVGTGCPIVLPLLGQSNLRDSFGMLSDCFLHPLNYIQPLEVAAAVRACEKENYVSLHIGEYESLKEDALDPYTLIRNAYRQKREADIKE